MPEIVGNNLAVSNALSIVQAQENRPARETRPERERETRESENVTAPQRNADPEALEEAFNALQTERNEQSRSALQQEPAGGARNAINLYQQTQSFLQRDQLANLVGFDDFG